MGKWYFHRKFLSEYGKLLWSQSQSVTVTSFGLYNFAIASTNMSFVLILQQRFLTFLMKNNGIFFFVNYTSHRILHSFQKFSNSTLSENQVFVCLATASPAKFPEACLAAGLDTPTNDTLERLKAKTDVCSPRHVFLRGQDWTSQLKDIILKIWVYYRGFITM